MAGRDAAQTLLMQLDGITSIRRSLGRSVPAGTLPPGVSALAVLDGHGRLRAGRLAELLGVDMSVASRHIAHLEAAGRVERQPNPEDRRSCLLSITPQGQEVLDRAREACTDVLAAALADWPDEDVRTLTRLFVRLHDSVLPASAQEAPQERGLTV